MIRTIFVFIAVGVLTFIAGLGSIIVGIFNPYSRMIYYFGQFWTRGILASAGVKLDVFGLDNFDPNGTYVFAGNHQSHFDVPIVFSLLPMTVRFFTKKELFRIPLFGSAISAVGMIKIDRTNHEQSVKTMNHAVDTIRKFDVSVVIFPEGTRSPDGKVRTFKKGGFIVAIKGGVPVVPVAISGSHRILKKHTLRVQPGRVKVVFGKPVDTSEMTYRERDHLIQQTRDQIIGMIDGSYNGSGSDQGSGGPD